MEVFPTISPRRVGVDDRHTQSGTYPAIEDDTTSPSAVTNPLHGRCMLDWLIPLATWTLPERRLTSIMNQYRLIFLFLLMTISACTDVTPGAAVHITEIMYHPVAENDFADNHEFIELHNAEAVAVPLTDWAFQDGIKFVFPAGTEIPAGGYMVVAKSAQSLLVEYPELTTAVVVGDYAGTLSNGGERVQLVRPDGSIADEVDYDDEFPYPSAADALGASAEWLDSDLLPVSGHQYRGYSLERVSVDHPATAPDNWMLSVLDGATPAAVNRAARAIPEPQVVMQRAIVDDTQAPVPVDRIIMAGDIVRFEVQMSAPIDKLQIEYFADDVNENDEPRMRLPLWDDGTNGDSAAQDLLYMATLPTHAERTIVRYRVIADRGAGDELIAPRPGEPFEWFAYFVSPDHGEHRTRTYEFFIANTDWAELDANIADGRVDGCDVRPEWTARVPAVFVHQGEVHDVRVRYSGSIFQRDAGSELSWPDPEAPSPVRALSWRVAFPRYHRFERKSVIVLNKLNQACAGFAAQVTFDMMEMLNLPRPMNQRYARQYVNGVYYNYTFEMNRYDERAMAHYEEEYAIATGQPEARLGHLFKANGSANEGPYRRAIGDVINEPSCGYTIDDHYAYTYDRKTHDWLDSRPVRELLEGLHTADFEGPVALRAFVDANFDVERMLDFLVVRQYGAPWDDDNHNWQAYQSRETGKWFMLPWDLDLTFGSTGFVNGSRYFSPLDVSNPAYQGDNSVRSNLNYMKWLFLKSYEVEYVAHLRALTDTTFSIDVLDGLLDTAYARFDLDDAEQSLASVACSIDERYNTIREFFRQRHKFIQAWPDPGRTNLALNRPVTASSISEDAFAAENANDEVVLKSNSFVSAPGDLAPVWRVELASPQAIAEIHVITRIDCCGDVRAYNLNVEILDDGGNVAYAHPTFNPWDGVGAPPVVSQPSFIHVDLSSAPIVGSAVQVRKQAVSAPMSSEILQLAEVTVYGR